MVRVKYNTLIPSRIYIGSENDAQDMADVANCDAIVDLREEAQKPAFSSGETEWIHLGLKDHTVGQEVLIKRAISTVVSLYNEGKVIGIHCASGVCRTGTIAVGVLIELGICKRVRDALEYVKISRNKTALHPNLKETLQNLYR